MTVDQAPEFTSGSSTTFAPKTSDTFKITTTGYPSAKITESGALPRRVSFKTTSGGTATISVTPTTKTETVYKLELTATNGVGKAATQTFTLTVT